MGEIDIGSDFTTFEVELKKYPITIGGCSTLCITRALVCSQGKVMADETCSFERFQRKSLGPRSIDKCYGEDTKLPAALHIEMWFSDFFP